MATDAQQQQHKTVTGTTIGGVVAMIRAKMTGGAGGAGGGAGGGAASGAKAEAAPETAPETDPKKTTDPETEPETPTPTATATESGTEAETAQTVETAAAAAATGGAPAPDAGVANAAAAAGADAAAGANAGGCDIEAVLAIACDDDAFLVKAVRAKMDAKTAAEAYVKHLKDQNAALKAEIGKAVEAAGGSKSPKFVSAKAGAPVKLSIAGAARADGAAGAGGSATVAAQIEAAERKLQADPDRLNRAIAEIQSQRPGMSRTDAMVELKKMIAAEIQTSVA